MVFKALEPVQGADVNRVGLARAVLADGRRDDAVLAQLVLHLRYLLALGHGDADGEWDPAFG
jgi:hypothetical protein